MSTVIPNGYGQVSIRYNLSGDLEPMYTVWGFKNDAAATDPSLTADVIQGYWTDSTSIGAPGIRYTGWSIGPSTVTLGTLTGPVTAPGTITSSPSAGVGATLPQNCTCLIRKTTTRGGREGRGRSYVPACMFQEGDVSAVGVILNTVVTNMQTRINAFLNLMAAGDFPVHLLHSDVLTSPDVVSSCQFQSVIATQRRRLRR